MLKRLSFLNPESLALSPLIREPIGDGPIRDDGIGFDRIHPPNDTVSDGDSADAITNDATTDAADYDGPWSDATDSDAFSFVPDTTGADGTIDSDCSDSCDSCCSCGEGFLENPQPCSCSCGGCGCGGCDPYYG
ncbi:MAG: hypothetical protein ABSE51_11045 [Terracidiphilus sp.]|jgi:hypothetical protein